MIDSHTFVIRRSIHGTNLERYFCRNKYQLKLTNCHSAIRYQILTNISQIAVKQVPNYPLISYSILIETMPLIRFTFDA